MKRPFPGQKPDEKIILFVRRHWASFLGFIGLVIAMVLILFFLFFALATFSPDTFINIRGALVLAGSAFLLFTLAFFLVGWIDFYFDIVIITDRRIVDIHQKGLFAREIDELDLLHIEDVSAKTKGILPTIFKYGDLYVQTAGTSPNFTFFAVPHPNRMRSQIMALYDAILETQSGRLKAMDTSEGLMPRHIHPPSESVEKAYEKELASEDEFQNETLGKDKNLTSYQKLLKEEKGKTNGEIREGEEIDFDKEDKNQ